MLWGLCHGVSKLRGPEEGGPNVEGIFRGGVKIWAQGSYYRAYQR